MGTQFFDLDINAKLPIIRAESISLTIDNSILNGITENNNNSNNNNNYNNTINSSTNNNHNNNNNNHQLDLPKPSFRPAPNYEYKRRQHTASQKKTRKSYRESYYHYEEPNAEALLTRLEYDMDNQDYEWLRMFNSQFAQKYNYEVTEGDFERIMDRLEKESYFEHKSSGKGNGPEVDEDAVCAICADGDCHNANVILFCDMCDLAVHQECYGVPYVPEGQWLCRRCLQSPSKNVKCVLCPNYGGAFKQTDDGRWAHVICALWVPEVCFANTVFLEPIDSIDQIPSARWKLTCYICRQKKEGACIQCHKPNCYVPFHVTCAQQAGLYMKIRTCKYETPDGPLTDVSKEAFCDAHGPSDGRGGGMYSGDDTDDEDIDSHAYKRWKQAKREKMRRTRKILAEKRVFAFNPTAVPKVPQEKMLEISKMLTMKGKRKPPMEFEEMRRQFMARIETYWHLKRKERNGVPLLRRLQVSYNSSSKANDTKAEGMNQERYKKLRYDLEKARLLIGEVKKREILKKKLLQLSKEVVEAKYNSIDNEHPPEE